MIRSTSASNNFRRDLFFECSLEPNSIRKILTENKQLPTLTDYGISEIKSVELFIRQTVCVYIIYAHVLDKYVLNLKTNLFFLI